MDDRHGHRHDHGPTIARGVGTPHPSGHPRIGIIGAGRVGTALGVALSRAGWPVVAVASRDVARRANFARLIPAARPFSEAPAVLDEADLVLLTVPDDAVAAVTAKLRLYGGQALVHTSGLLPASVLEPALAAGARGGAFHPLVAFADLERAVASLVGATVAVDAEPPLLGVLGEMAEAIGAQPVRIGGGGRAAYHAAAMLAAGGFVGLLHAIAEVGRGAGLDEAGSLAIYAPLIRQSLANAESLGIDAALTGPVVRGDEQTIRAHLDALRRLAPGALRLYRAAAAREVEIAVARGALDAAGGARLQAILLEGQGGTEPA
ncbi:MAG: DUF2520 domain-containing protein [Chloroflexi bacterium]|nr:DUF2520 domain-containing protein [Chloroflexota bacterium]